jgi:hypothetical protein
MKQNIRTVFKDFAIQLPLYAVLMFGYAYLILHFLDGWLSQLYHDDRRIYAVAALALIGGQGLLLDLVTRTLLGWIKGKKEE